MSNKIKKFLNEYWPLLVVVLVTIPILFVACFNKNVYNVDESLSYSLSNYDMGWMNYPMNGICTRYVMVSIFKLFNPIIDRLFDTNRNAISIEMALFFIMKCLLR